MKTIPGPIKLWMLDEHDSKDRNYGGEILLSDLTEDQAKKIIESMGYKWTHLKPNYKNIAFAHIDLLLKEAGYKGLRIGDRPKPDEYLKRLYEYDSKESPEELIIELT